MLADRAVLSFVQQEHRAVEVVWVHAKKIIKKTKTKAGIKI